MTIGTISGQMMSGPNMMNKGKMGMGSGMNFTRGENITGSIDFMSAITKAIASQIKTSLSDASSAAEKSIGNNSRAVAGHVSDENGYLVYVVAVVDSNGKVHKLIIDPSNGKILLSRELSGFEALMMLHQGMQAGGHDMSMMNPDFNYGHPMMMSPGSNFGR
ncbi:MAG TPA: PepSY domain-containing protein [Nitrososphaeraceae archaeon]